MNATLDIQRRADRLHGLPGKATTIRDFGLLQVLTIPQAAFQRLQTAATVYVWQTLSAANPDRAIACGTDILATERTAVLALPNRTPNGVIMPRRENLLGFNLVHRCLADIFRASGLADAFTHIQLPCNVRIVDGSPDPAAEKRPYASSKMHSDLWAGEPLSAILFNLAVLGDPEAADLDFYQPSIFPEDIAGPITDYEIGASRLGTLTRQDVLFRFGSIFMSDSLSLHKTIKRQPRLRLSIDLRALPKALLPGESSDFAQSKASYIPASEWFEAGDTSLLVNGAPIDAFQRQARGEAFEKASHILREVE